MSENQLPPPPIPTDPRLTDAEPRMVALMQAMRLNGSMPNPTLTPDAPRDKVHEHYIAVEGFMAMGGPYLFGSYMESPDVATETVAIEGVDNNEINLHIHTPKNVSGPIPCVYHIHGGGMGVMSTNNEYYNAIRTLIAKKGIVAIGVEFRNSTGNLGPHPFPAGLNDCLSGLKWVYENKSVRNISKVVVYGESGGANLALAVTIKAKQDNLLHLVNGVYAMCPFIYGRYNYGDDEDAKLPSLAENDGLFLNLADLQLLASCYLPEGEDARNYPLAWPYWASEEDLTGLPPHVITVNELDPLRSEGLAYYRKLMRAGVRVRCHTVGGTVHAGDLFFMRALPDITNASIADLSTFANEGLDA